MRNKYSIFIQNFKPKIFHDTTYVNVKKFWNYAIGFKTAQICVVSSTF